MSYQIIIGPASLLTRALCASRRPESIAAKSHVFGVKITPSAKSASSTSAVMENQTEPIDDSSYGYDCAII